MFMQIAIGAIGIAIVLMVAYVVISQVKSALPSSSTVQVENPCYGQIGDVTPSGDCTLAVANTTWTAPDVCGSANLTGYNTSAFIGCENLGYTTGTASAQATVFAGLGLIAVGIIVLAAFGLISVFQ